MLSIQCLQEYNRLVSSDTLKVVLNHLILEYKTKHIFPKMQDVFKPFRVCPYKDLKVVIIGQDPYPQKGYATGLAFANPENTKIISPSLQLIKDRIYLDFPEYSEGFIDELPFGNPFEYIFDITLESWAKQGVLLLNSALTIEENKIGSHSNIWYPFMKELIKNLSEVNSGIIYMLLGNDAKIFKSFINKKSNYILEYKHPAYYARNNEFFQCDGFKKVNKILKENHNIKINWYGI